jgi:hypothetical protein
MVGAAVCDALIATFMSWIVSVILHSKVDKINALPAVEEPNWDQTDRRFVSPSNSPNDRDR